MKPLAVLGVLATFGLSAIAHFIALGVFVVGVCGVSDTADTFPADASPQGQVCGAQQDSWWGLVGFGGLFVSTVVAALLVVLLWRRGGMLLRWLSPMVLVVLPVVTVLLLGLPSDTCSDQARRDHPAYDCRTTPDG